MELLRSTSLIIFLFSAIGLSCGNKKNLSQTQTKTPATDSTKSQYAGEFDEQLFQNDNLEKLKGLTERINWLKNDKREVFYYDANWKITTPDKAQFVSSIKHLKDDNYLVKDYWLSGERQFAGVFRTMQSDVDWSKIYDSKDYSVRKVGKMVYWKKIGEIDYIFFQEWTDWEKGHFHGFRLNKDELKEFKEPPGTDFKIKNSSKLKVDIVYEQEGSEEDAFIRPDYFGGLRAVFTPKLTFLFNKKGMSIENGKGNMVPYPQNINANIPALFSTKSSTVKEYKRETSFGWMELSFVETSCDDTDYNSFLLETNGEIRIEGLLNCELFIFDSDGDGYDEFYIFSFRSCENSLKVIRIMK